MLKCFNFRTQVGACLRWFMLLKGWKLLIQLGYINLLNALIICSLRNKIWHWVCVDWVKMSHPRSADAIPVNKHRIELESTRNHNALTSLLLNFLQHWDRLLYFVHFSLPELVLSKLYFLLKICFHFLIVALFDLILQHIQQIRDTLKWNGEVLI